MFCVPILAYKVNLGLTHQVLTFSAILEKRSEMSEHFQSTSILNSSDLTRETKRIARNAFFSPEQAQTFRFGRNDFVLLLQKDGSWNKCNAYSLKVLKITTQTDKRSVTKHLQCFVTFIPNGF